MNWEKEELSAINNEYAVSEVIGSALLLLIAVLSFSAIYMYVFPLPIPTEEPHVKLIGYVNENGTVVLEHVGGEALEYYRIDV
ncbi:MAG TPA: type IV pilin, partial [Thermoplasmatales archaeon]|nr:type IV pilin [Thermoplasmatales archaeon]